MKVPIISIVEEPEGKVYRALVRLATTCCDQFYLVWRDQADFAPDARGIASDLKRWLIREERTDTWDGNRLMGHFATLTHYQLNPQSAQVLMHAVARLYAWNSPDRPEDLTFYTSSGALWMLSVAHEEFAHFDGRWVSLQEVQRHVPGIVLKPAFHNRVSFLDRKPAD